MELNDKFGDLTVVGFSTKSRRGYNCKSVLCSCSCGNAYEGFPNELKSGRVVSCGCRRNAGGADRKLINLAGNKYGKLTVLEHAGHVQVGSKGRYRVNWLCECSCGTRVTVTSNSLRTGNTQSCGCLIQETRTANEQSVARKMRSVALRAGKVWTLDVDVAAELVKQNCYYCGAEPKVTGQDNKYVKRNGIDRLDSSKGYEEGNVVTCCKRCNVAKNDQTSAEYEKQIENNYKQLILRKKGNNINGKSQLSSTAWRP